MSESKPARRTIRRLEDEEAKRHKRLINSIGKGGLWPLNAPGMPPPGPDFLRHARDIGDDTEFVKGTTKKPGVYNPGGQLVDLYRRALREPGFSMSIEIRQGKRGQVTFVPGHIWGQHSAEWAKSLADPHYTPPPVDGPHPATVMVLGKMPWREETTELRNLVGASGEILTGLVDKFHIKGAHKWYVTNLVKFMPPEDYGSTTLRAGWIHDCLPLLHQELRIVKPKYILCLGADASKWLLGDKFNVSYMAGRVIPYTFPIHMSQDDDPEQHTAHVMTVLHPAEVSRSPEKGRILESNFARFTFLLEGNNFDLEEKNLDHRACYTLEDALDWIEEVNADFYGVPRKDRLLAVDLEWQGQHPVNAGSYVRTVQFSWAEKKAIAFVLAHPGGKCAFRDRDGKPAVKRLVRALNEFVKDKRIVGHFLVSDMEWAESIGLHLIDGCQIPLYARDGKQAWQLLQEGEGWLDTSSMNHAIEETAPLGLEMLTMRYTTAPRYDIPLEDWKTKYCAERGIKKEALEGYGDCPDHILTPYALYDADATRRIAVSLGPLLSCDYEGNNCWEAFWESMIVQKPILRIHQNGILVDRARIDDLTKKFITWKAKKEEEVQQTAQWPEFNIRSVQQVREYLFGEFLNGKKDEQGRVVRLRPPGARSLYLTPLLDTAKPPRRWSDLEERGLTEFATPGTGKMILGILGQENLNLATEINMIRDYRFLDQVLKSVLRPPKTDDDDNWIENDEGFLEYDAGLGNSIDDDGRVRTHIYPTAETGRWKHARPNLANIAKSRDPDYVRLLGGHKDESGNWVGGDYTHTLRSALMATPGWRFIEFDYMGAELYMMALMAGSKKMQDHCLRAMLPEKGYDEKGNAVPGGKYPHPDFYDIHSNVAVLAFQLRCLPTKSGLKSIGKSHFRTLAKNVIFGIAYGRGAKAIAFQAKEQGVDVTPDEAQQVIDAIFAMYSELVPFFEEARRRAVEERWLCHCYGRFRRFPKVSDFKQEGEFERQAMNFPIQGGIASAVDRGLAYLQDAIERQNLQNDIRLLLQIHDAGLVEARDEIVPYAKQLIKWAMVDMVEIWPTDLAGVPRGDGPYHLALDFGVYDHWGEKAQYPAKV